MFGYASIVLWVMFKYKPPALLISTSLIAAWLVTSFGIWFLVLK
jgi:hypothetical protein